MIVLPTAEQLHMAGAARRLTVAGAVYKRDGTVIRCSQADVDLEIDDGDLAGLYRSTTTISASEMKSATDMSVDNLEVTGFLNRDFDVSGFTSADIEAGLFDNAPFETFLCQWDAPNDWQHPMRRGYLGVISRTAEDTFKCEWRGLLQAIQQVIGETYSDGCDVVDFGDQRCGLVANVLGATVTAVTAQNRFDVTLAGSKPAFFFNLGNVAFTTGGNVGYTRQVKVDISGDGTNRNVWTWEQFPKPVTVGDTLTLREGCDRLFTTCQAKNNVVNFRGHGHWIPGIPNILRAP